MTVVRTRAPRAASSRTVGVCLAGLTVAVSGCAGREPADTDTARATATPASTATTSAPTPSSTPASPDGCPVDAATLLAALKANKELSAALYDGISGMRDVACHRGYATATTIVPPKIVDPAFVAYRYDPTSTRWTAIAAGTDAICTDLVPADIIPRLPACINS